MTQPILFQHWQLTTVKYIWPTFGGFKRDLCATRFGQNESFKGSEANCLRSFTFSWCIFGHLEEKGKPKLSSPRYFIQDVFVPFCWCFVDKDTSDLSGSLKVANLVTDNCMHSGLLCQNGYLVNKAVHLAEREVFHGHTVEAGPDSPLRENKSSFCRTAFPLENV